MTRESCLGGRSRSSMLLEHHLKTRDDHKDDNVPTFAFLHDYYLHTEDITSVHQSDYAKAALFQMLEKSRVLRNTLVVHVSDHGSQQQTTTTSQGAIECKLPFWYLAVPKQVLIERDQGTREALEANKNVMTS